jgi:hypothetical protein
VSSFVEIASAQSELGEHSAQQARADLLAQILQRRLLAPVVQRSVAALAVAPVVANDNAVRPPESGDPTQELVAGHLHALSKQIRGTMRAPGAADFRMLSFSPERSFKISVLL